MTKIKNVQRRAVRASRQPTKRTSKGMGAAGVVIAALGWLAALGMAVITVVTIQRDKAEQARIPAALEQHLRDLQAQVTRESEEISQRKVQLGKQIAEQVRRQELLHVEVQSLLLMIKELEPQIPPLEAAMAKVRQTVGAVKEDAGFAGEGLDELRKKSEDLENDKLRLTAQYRERFDRMNAEFESRMARPEPEMLRQFYSANRHTPFAPAAGFFAAEKMYQRKRSTDAIRFYREVLERYPDSSYAAYCQTRIAQIEVRAAFRELDPGPGLIPYKALQFRDEDEVEE